LHSISSKPRRVDPQDEPLLSFQEAHSSRRFCDNPRRNIADQPSRHYLLFWDRRFRAGRLWRSHDSSRSLADLAEGYDGMYDSKDKIRKTSPMPRAVLAGLIAGITAGYVSSLFAEILGFVIVFVACVILCS